MGEDTCCGSATPVLFSFLLGGIIGAGVALLLAPQSGTEARRKLSEFSDDARDRAEDYYEHAMDTVTSAVEKGKDILDEKKTVLDSAIEAGKEAFQKEREKDEGEPQAEA